MATKHKRLSVRVSPDTAKIIEALSEAVGKSQSAIIMEVLDEAAPGLKASLAAYRMSKRNKRGALEKLSATFDEMIREQRKVQRAIKRQLKK